MKIFTVQDHTQFSEHGYNRKELHATDNSKIMQICFQAGQAVEPCVMSRYTMFYIVEGEGIVKEDNLEEAVSAGSIILINPELTRQIVAKSNMIVLAVQYS